MVINIWPTLLCFLAFMHTSVCLAETVRCRIVDIDLGVSALHAVQAHIVRTQGRLFLQCSNSAETVKTVELALYDGVKAPHLFVAKGASGPVELRFHKDPSRSTELPTDPEQGVIHYRHISPARQEIVELPIFPQFKVPARFPEGDFSIPFTLRVTVAEVSR